MQEHQNKQVTVIGDIHGVFDTFMELLKKIPEGDIIVCAGDFIDRGPKSKEVIQYLIDHPEIKCVQGNHENMCYTDILSDTPKTPFDGEWLAYQAKETLQSYKREDGIVDMDLLREHAKWMKSLPYYLEFHEYKDKLDRHLVVSHASLGSTWHFKDKIEDHRHHTFLNNCIWNRDPPRYLDNIYNVFGHTPCYMEPKIKSFFANIDTGCVFNRPGYSKLTALRWPSLEIIQQQNIDKKSI